MELYPNSKVYILCPRGYASGGPESLHQLCLQLRALNVNAFMFYISANKKFDAVDPVNEHYRKYHLPYTFELEDSEENVFIVAENFVEYLYKFKKIRRVLWWLSVNNYVRKISTLIGDRMLSALKEPLPKVFYFAKEDDDIVHFFQSEYARQFLELNAVKNMYPVETNMSQIFLRQANRIDFSKKENIVAYNPKKGFEITEQLIKFAPDIDWRQIKDMTVKQVQEFLAKSKVYIDFGDFRGRERLPREAALSGCVVITGKRGAAENNVDINIPDEFKFDDSDSDLPQVIEKIRAVFENFETAYASQQSFREKELNALKKFRNEIITAFEIKQLPPPSAAFVKGTADEIVTFAERFFKNKECTPHFIVDDGSASEKFSEELLWREQNRIYLRVGENLIEIVNWEDAKFLYYEGRIDKFIFFEPIDEEFDF